MTDKLWICGQITKYEERDGVVSSEWEFAGVFDTEEKAIAACHTDWFFIGPTNLNGEWPIETTEWTGAYYPLAEDAGAMRQ